MHDPSNLCWVKIVSFGICLILSEINEFELSSPVIDTAEPIRDKVARGTDAVIEHNGGGIGHRSFYSRGRYPPTLLIRSSVSFSTESVVPL